MKVKMAPRALQRARIIKAWWRTNRPGVEAMFERELDEATSRLAAMSPRSPLGIIYAVHREKTIRRLLLRKTGQNIYYSVNEADDTVIVRTIWGARRGRPPRL